jgi:hypothetical protein
MKNKFGFAALLLAMGIVVFWGCKSTGTVTEVPPEPPPPPAAPEPPPPPPPPAPPKLTSGPDQAALDALDAAIARAERGRKLAEDFKSPSYFPAEWGAAEADYGSITADKTSAEAVQDAQRRYNAAADTYEALFRNTVPLYAADIQDAVLKARDEAIAAGILDYVPEYLDLADEVALGAERAYLAEDYYKAEAEALEALDRYRSLKTGMEAYLIREEVERRDFAGFDQARFDRADASLLAAAAAYEGGAVKDALAGAGESKTLYDGVLKAGWAAYAAQLRGLAQRERRNALDAKANVAVREDFSRVDQIFNQAESAYASKVYNNAADLYIRAEAGFVETVLAAEEKRRIAQAAIEAADKKLAESESTVESAEKILEGGEE